MRTKEIIELFPKNDIEVNTILSSNDNPKLISFRNLVPEITNTSYLTHAIYYYPAKFIPHVVKYCIDKYTKLNDWILDPFAGSGTVGLEANISRRNAVLLDINFLLNHIIPIKIPIEKDELSYRILNQHLDLVFNSIHQFAPSWSNITYWYPEEILEVLMKYWGGVKSLDKNLYTQIIQSVLIRISKLYSWAEHKTPKLFKSKSKKEYLTKLLETDWKSQIIKDIKILSQDTLKDVNNYLKKTQDNTNKVIFLGGTDSSTYQLNHEIKIDCVITSPPYLQAQEYIRTFKMDLYWLGYSENEVKSISKLEIPYRKANRIIQTQTLNSLRKKIENENLVNLMDSYFCHTINSLENAFINLKSKGTSCVFVGNPKIEGIEVETWRILFEYFSDKGFVLQAIFEDRIKTRQLFKSRKNKNPDGMKSEYLLVMEKAG